MYLSIILILVFVAVFASLMTQGLWTNFITLVNVITAGLVATNYFEPLADYFDRQEPRASYLYDFITIWVIFGITLLALRLATDWMSQVKVRFFMPVEKAGGILMALWVSWIMVCFTTMTLHTAPLSRHFLGFQQTPETHMLFGLQPDRVWMGWVYRESKGTFSRFGGARPFDARGSFIVRYSNRRGAFEDQMSTLKSSK